MAFTLKRKTDKLEEVLSAKAEKAVKQTHSLKKKAEKNKKIKTPKTTFKKQTVFVLLIGDEGAILTHIKKGVVEGRWFAQEAKEEHFELFDRAIKEHPKTPFVVLLDTIDQTYMQQNLPPVNKMGLGSIMRRRLKREFGNVELKGSRLLGREENKKEWLFQMIAVDTTDVVRLWLNWIASTTNKCIGIRFLPLEMEKVINTIYQKSVEPAKQAHNWLYLLSHHKVSGFRQTILRDGKMVFTRIGQNLNGAADVTAGLVESEVNSTVEYLKRIGLRNASDLHLHLIASQDVIQMVDQSRTNVGSFKKTTPHQTSELLGLINATQPTDRYGDMVSLTAVANLKKATLNIFTKDLEKLAKLYKGLLAIQAFSALLVIGFTIGTMFSLYEAYISYSENSEFTQKIKSLDADLEKTKAEMASIADIDKIKDVMDIYAVVEKKKLTPASFLLLLSKAKQKLGDSVLIKRVEWKDAVATAAPNQAKPAEMANQASANSVNSIMVIVDISYIVKEGQNDQDVQGKINEIVGEIKPIFENYTLTVSQISGIKTSTESMNLDFSDEAKEKTNRDVTAKINFVGTEQIPEVKLTSNKGGI